jgi:hypothetical protein
MIGKLLIRHVQVMRTIGLGTKAARFLFLVFWATTHSTLAVSIYPYEFLDDCSEGVQCKALLQIMLEVLFADLAENAVRGVLAR